MGSFLYHESGLLAHRLVFRPRVTILRPMTIKRGIFRTSSFRLETDQANTRPSPADVTATDPELREQIDQLATRTPRFLFRIWAKRSGDMFGEDNPVLNTINAVTPPGHFHGNGPAAIYNMSRCTIADMATRHMLKQRAADTVFSSWTQSLQWVLELAKDLTTHDRQGLLDSTHISIVDTKKLDKNNVVLFTPPMNKLLRGGRGATNRDNPGTFTYPVPMNNYHEFLAFGVIAGTAYKAVLYRDMVKLSPSPAHGKNKFDSTLTELLHDTPMAGEPTIKAVVESCRDDARLFGPQFELPMTAYLISLREHDR